MWRIVPNPSLPGITLQTGKERTMRRLTLPVLLVALIFLVPSLAASETLADKVTEFQLDNGMKFIVVKRDVSPTFFGVVGFDVGSINERDGITGISHLLEHMMFKGTTTVGTTNYSKEKKYISMIDDLALEVMDTRWKIGRWRLEMFDDFSRDLMSGLSEEDREAIGSDKIKELSVLIGLLESTDLAPAQVDTYPTLMEEAGVDYYGMYVHLKHLELELAEVQKEHKQFVVKDELWDTYKQQGGRMLNAFTANDLTAYIVALPANRLELWMMLESDRMKNAVFREFYSERDVVMEERRLGENDPDSELWDALMAAAFEASPYGRPVVGWMSDLQMMTRQEVEAYFRQYYAPNNATAMLVGDLDPAEVERLAQQYFGRIKAQEPPPPVVTVEPEQMGERRVVVEFDANPKVLIGYHVPVAPHPDAYAIEVLAAVLGQGRTSRFYKTIYEDLELTSEPPDVSMEPGSKLPDLFTIGAVPRHPHTVDEVEQAIYAEIENIAAEPPAERELQRIRNTIDAQMVRSLGSNYGIAFQLGFSELIRGDWHTYLEDIERIKAVTPEQVSAVARKYLVPANRTVATLVKIEKEEEESPAEESEMQESDVKALIQWVRTLPQEEQQEIFTKFQSLTPEERKEFARQLWERMQATTE
jgi:predicted Zn-dependent peptidase